MSKIEIKNTILMISPLPPPVGGIASWTKKYLEWAEEKSLKVELINTAVIGTRATTLNKRISTIEETKRTLTILREVSKKTKVNKNYTVHLNTPCGTFGVIRDYICVKIVKKRKLPLVVHYRCNIEDQVGKNILKKHLVRKISSIADENIVLNTPSRKYIQDIANKKSKIVSNFISKEYVITSEKKINDKLKKIIFVGHVQKTKGYMEILSAAKETPNINFEIVGPISKDIENIPVPNNVQFKGVLSRNEVRKNMLDADVFLFPTYTEGFSNALLEAMAVGLPVIATQVGANEDMIENFGGYLIPSKNEKQLITAIKDIMDFDRRRNFSRWNVNKVTEKYLIENIMEELEQIYRSLELRKDL